MSSFVRHLETTASRGRLLWCNPTCSTVLTAAVCPITSHLQDAPLFRIPVPAGRATGLKLQSQVMVDKVIAIPRTRSRGVPGCLPRAPRLKEIDNALRLWLELT